MSNWQGIQNRRREQTSSKEESLGQAGKERRVEERRAHWIANVCSRGVKRGPFISFYVDKKKKIFATPEVKYFTNADLAC